MSNYIIDQEPETSMVENFPILSINDCYTCVACSSPVEILAINEKENTLTFKCLNPITKNNHNVQTVSINEYINKMEKYTYLYSECSICKKFQNQSRDIPIFSYCIKCDKIICNDCINDHLKLNKGNHQNMNKEFIIKNNEKGIQCLIHPGKKILVFVLIAMLISVINV